MRIRFPLSLLASLIFVLPVPVRAAEPKNKTDGKNAAAKIASERALARSLVRKYRDEYRRFKTGLIKMKAKSPRERVQFLTASNRAINAIFKSHVESPAMRIVLPELVDTLGIDLQPTLTAVIRKNPDTEIAAVAVYTFAVHLHKNNRDRKKAIQLLEYTQKKLANVSYKNTTLGKMAERSLYVFGNLSVGMTAPDVSGVDADGVKFQISDYHGKVIVLRFWGDWCPFCRSMFPQERELVDRLRNKPFVLIGVNSDSRARLKKAQREKNLVWRSFWDGGNTDGPIAGKYHVTDWPTIYVIDHRGIIRYKGTGIRGARVKWLDAAVDKLIAESMRKQTK
ncbi:MAG: TlpA family protein disulfide reductase [Planctomycetes bacterium]|nr:TlpA family protein disulfide reductase [Planctomycetota bacterium]